MSEILFYPDTPDKLAFACHFVARGHAAGRKLVVRAPDAASAEQLDRVLWVFDSLAFIPHVRAGHPLSAETPVLIIDAGDDTALAELAIDDVLINLAASVPPAYQRFKLLIEPVGPGEAERLAGRQRWIHYRQQGHEPRLAGKGANK